MYRATAEQGKYPRKSERRNDAGVRATLDINAKFMLINESVERGFNVASPSAATT